VTPSILGRNQAPQSEPWPREMKGIDLDLVIATLSWTFAFALIAATIAACSTDPNLPERSFATARD
jgi:hypothetical protein